MVRGLQLCVLSSLVFGTVPAWAGESLDLRAWLDRPGVKLVAVELYATWCKPCMEAVPKWKALHERYAAQGLRLVVVATQDPKGGCVNPGWNPDDVVCDEEGFIARSFGAGERLPAAFLWTWQGRLLVRQGHVGEVEAAIEKWMKEAPRVDLDVTIDKDAGIDGATLKTLVRSKLNDYDKLIVVAGKEEQAQLDKLKKRSFEARYDDKLQCEIGKELSANSLLHVQVLGKAPHQRLQLGLFSAERGCLTASAIVDWNAAKPNVSVSEAVGELIQKLHADLEMPRGTKSEIAFGGSSSFEIRVPQVQVGTIEGGLGGLNLKVEQLLDQAKGAEEDASAPPEKKAAAWCALAAVEDKNPYRDKAREGCQAWRTYARAYRKQSASLDEDYHTLAGYLALERTSREQRIAATDAFVSAHGAQKDDPRVRAVQSVKADLGIGRAKVELPELVSEHEGQCAAGDAPSCTLAANAYAKGLWPKTQDVAKAAELFTKACEGGDVAACLTLAGQLAEGKGIAKDLDRASTLFERACAENDLEGCMGAGSVLAASVDDARVVRGADAYRRACELGDAHGCERAGSIYRAGRGGPESAARMVDVTRRSCELGENASCLEAGRAYDEGKSVPRDAVRALPLYRKACDGGMPPACRRLAEMTAAGEGMEKDPAKAAELFERSCGAGEALACESLAELVLDGRGVAKDESRAAKLLEKACDGNVRSSCSRLAKLLETGVDGKTDRARAAVLWDKACKDGDGAACTALANIYEEGSVIPNARDRALPTYQLGCEKGDAAGCAKVAEAKAKEQAIANARAEHEARRERAAAWRSRGWWLVVPGLIFGGGAGTFAWLGDKTNEDIRGGGLATAEEITSTADRGQLYNTAGTALAIAGGAALVLGLPMILFNLDPGALPEGEAP